MGVAVLPRFRYKRHGVEAPEGPLAEHHTSSGRRRGVSLFMFSCFLHLLFDCFWYRRQAVLFITAEDIVPADGGGDAPPADEEPVAAPAPAAAQTTNTTDTNVNAVDLTRSWSHGEWNEWARRDE